MKNIYIIVQSNPDYAIDWKAFKRPANSLLFIICDEVSAKAADMSGEFTALYRTSNFDVQSLSDCIDEIYDTYVADEDENENEEKDEVTISTVSEYDVLTCAQLRDKYFMKGAGAICLEYFRDKLRMKEVVFLKNFRVPKYVVFSYESYIKYNTDYIHYLEKTLGYPMFAKPVDGASSVDTALINTRQKLREWMVAHQHSTRTMEIEEFIEGDLFHCDIVMHRGQCLQTFVSQYLHPNAAALQGKPLASLMLKPNAPHYTLLKKFAENVLKSFPELPDGCFHLEVFISNQNRELVFLEVGARPVGGKVPEMYSIHTQGVDFRALHHYLSLQIPIPQDLIAKLKSPKGPFAAMFIMVNPPEGGLIEHRIKPSIQSEHTLVWKCIEGDELQPPKSNNDIVGSLVFSHADYNVLATDFQALNSYAPLQLKQHHCFVGEPVATVRYGGKLFGVVEGRVLHSEIIVPAKSPSPDAGGDPAPADDVVRGRVGFGSS